jgi:hypothetical protein
MFFIYILSLLYSTVYSQDLYNQLRHSAVSVSDSYCSVDLLATLEEVSVVLAEKGISQDFVDSLSTLQIVSGDLPAAATFRSQLKSTILAYEEAIKFNVTDAGTTQGKGIQLHDTDTRFTSSASWTMHSVFLPLILLYYIL